MTRIIPEINPKIKTELLGTTEPSVQTKENLYPLVDRLR